METKMKNIFKPILAMRGTRTYQIVGGIVVLIGMTWYFKVQPSIDLAGILNWVLGATGVASDFIKEFSVDVENIIKGYLLILGGWKLIDPRKMLHEE